MRIESYTLPGLYIQVNFRAGHARVSRANYGHVIRASLFYTQRRVTIVELDIEHVAFFFSSTLVTFVNKVQLYWRGCVPILHFIPEINYLRFRVTVLFANVYQLHVCIM